MGETLGNFVLRKATVGVVVHLPPEVLAIIKEAAHEAGIADFRTFMATLLTCCTQGARGDAHDFAQWCRGAGFEDVAAGGASAKRIHEAGRTYRRSQRALEGWR